LKKNNDLAVFVITSLTCDAMCYIVHVAYLLCIQLRSPVLQDWHTRVSRQRRRACSVVTWWWRVCSRDYSQQLEVYDAVTLTLQRHIIVPGLGSLSHGLTSCPNNNCLCVSDWIE